ncbi:hypothetical protein I3760_10G066600 [Carya illinoinensis]|nr:hypothetical protein I3760_10G066600 [Carya illinoinensis]
MIGYHQQPLERWCLLEFKVLRSLEYPLGWTTSIKMRKLQTYSTRKTPFIAIMDMICVLLDLQVSVCILVGDKGPHQICKLLQFIKELVEPTISLLKTFNHFINLPLHTFLLLP